MSCMKELYYAIEEAFEVPNSWLPEEYHNDKTGYVTLSKLNKQCNKKEGISEHKKLKAEKARHVEIYRKQIEENGEIEYVDIDEEQLYKNQIAWAKYCPGMQSEDVKKPQLYRVIRKRENRVKRRIIFSKQRQNNASNL